MLRSFGVGAMLLIGLTVGCSSSDPAEPAPILTPLSSLEVVSRSSEALANVTSFRFALSHDGGNTILTNGIQVQQASGTALAPDSYTLAADTLVAGFFVNTEVVVIDQDAYMTHPITRQWQLLGPDASPFGNFNPALLVSSILEQVSDPVMGFGYTTQPVGYLIDGNLPAAALSSLTGGVDEAAPALKVRVSVDATTFLPVEARVTGRATVNESSDLIRTVRLFEFDSDIAIEPPI
ncbi:MAG: LppX_LprAFG lipoprotein [Chloroflexi bacterium]|nr:LppX_LprAFG lipoprotein [Chloroflexota bacterium]